MSLEIKNNSFGNLVKPKIVSWYWDCESSDKKSDSFVCITATNGTRDRTIFYLYDELQNELTEYMDVMGMDRNNPNRSLDVVLTYENYHVLEVVLGAGLLPVKLPRLEEASEATQAIYHMFMYGPNYPVFLDKDHAEGLAREYGLTLDGLADTLEKDIERFGLQEVMFLYSKGAVVWVNCKLLSAFSRVSSKARIIGCDYSAQIPLFSRDDSVYIYAMIGNRNRILCFSYSDLQDRLAKYLEVNYPGFNFPDRYLEYVLENKLYGTLEDVLVWELDDEEVPALEESSKSIQLLYHRILDSTETDIRLSVSDADTFARVVGLSSWREMREQLKKDIEQFDLNDVIHFLQGDYVMVVSDKLLSFFTT